MKAPATSRSHLMPSGCRLCAHRKVRVRHDKTLLLYTSSTSKTFSAQNIQHNSRHTKLFSSHQKAFLAQASSTTLSSVAVSPQKRLQTQHGPTVKASKAAASRNGEGPRLLACQTPPREWFREDPHAPLLRVAPCLGLPQLLQQDNATRLSQVQNVVVQGLLRGAAVKRPWQATVLPNSGSTREVLLLQAADGSHLRLW